MATTAAEACFIDTNVLIYANQAGAAHHANAMALLAGHEASAAPLWISGQILRE